MKIIDLLQRIANEEEVPSKIKYDNIIFELNKIDMTYENSNSDLSEFMVFDYKSLNDEVEIIEEKKKILDEININLAYIDKEYLLDKEAIDGKINEIINRHNILIDKINEVLDYLKSKGE